MRESKRTTNFRLHILCPNCSQPAFGFRKRQLSTLVTELAYECRNPMCRGSFVFQGEVSRWLTIPANLDPRLNVPLSPIVERRMQLDAIANLQTATLPEEGEIIQLPRGSQIDIFSDQPDK